MNNNRQPLLLTILASGVLFSACQKEIDGSISANAVPEKKKPKLGTQWTYSYTTFYSFGGVIKTDYVTYSAASEDTIGGEKWLRVIDTKTNATVYLLREKTESLYQYTNSSSNLFFKYPAVVNDTYNTYNAGINEDFTVKSVGDTIYALGKALTINVYQGYVAAGYMADEFWYNDEVWIAGHIFYRKPFPFSIPFKYSTLILRSIIY